MTRVLCRWLISAGYALATVALALELAAGTASAQAQPVATAPEPASAASGTEFGVLVDAYYAHQFNGLTENVPLRNFDAKGQTFDLSMAEVWLSSAPTSARRVGYNIKFTFGSAASMINAYEPGATPGLQNVQQAYASYLAPVGKGLQVDVGKFVTPHGAEVIEAKDDWNYSRSLLFALAIPYYHLGVRLGYAPSDKVSLSGFVVNGWNNVVDNNTGKTLGVGLGYKPTTALSFVANYMAGPEQANQNDGWRRLFDATATWTVTPALSLMANYDDGRDTVAGQAVKWTGLAGYAKVQVAPWLALSPRVEWYDDPQGATTGLAQTLKEVTVTAECKAADGLLIRAEYRRDWSSKAFFGTSGDTTLAHQSSIAVAMMYSFSRTW